MKNISEVIVRSIKENKWIDVRYDNTKEKKITNFWLDIVDIDQNKNLLCNIFNSFKSYDCLESITINIDRIIDCKLIEWSSGKEKSELINKIKSNSLTYEFLDYEKFNNNILKYLLRCNEIDTDPFQKKYALIDGIDLESLSKSKVFKLNEIQIKQICDLIYEDDINKFVSSNNELVLSLLSIDIRNKKYIVAYKKILFDPKAKTLNLENKVCYNPTFLIDGIKHSLHQYSEIDIDEFKELFEKDFNAACELLKDGIGRKNEKINTRPDVMILERDLNVNLKPTYDVIEEEYLSNNSSIPIKAFFGNMSTSILKNKGSRPRIVIYNDNINIDQVRVIYNALKNNITYVQGPPGTGKTYTLFNTILSAYFNKKSVLITSNNNKPIEGIIEKFNFNETKYGSIMFPFLRLGNKEVLKTATLKIKTDFLFESKFSPDENKIDKISDIESNNTKKLSDLLEKYEKRLNIIEKIALLNEVAKKINKNNWKINEEIKKLEEELKNTKEIKNSEVLGLFSPASKSKLYQQYLYFDSLLHIYKLKNEEYKDLIDIVFIQDDEERVREFSKYISEDKNLEKLIKVYPVIFSTNNSSSKLATSKVKFDLGIMDEAGQADIARSLLMIQRCKSLLLVGDIDQLKPVIVIDKANHDKIFNEYMIGDNYSFYNESILSSMLKNDKVSPRIALTYHYRCGKKIINFSNNYFYNHVLKLDTLKNNGILELYNVENNTCDFRNSYYEEACGIVDYIKKNKVHDAKIICPFKNQENLINILLKKENINGVNASTIHSMQGGEADTIILSCAISKKTSDITMKRLNDHKEIANVAVTRAKNRLVLFCDTKALETKCKDKESVWLELMRYAKKNGNYNVIVPKVDILQIGKSNRSISEDELVETMSHFISCYKDFKIERNKLVRDVFKDDESLKNSEQEFDLVIYKKRLFKEDILYTVVELNGGEHYGDPKTQFYDKKKREILKKKNVMLLVIDNDNTKNYELLKQLIFGMKKSHNKQLSLFKEEE